MLIHHCMTAWLHLINNRLYSLINIVGLAAGLAAFLLIFLYVQNEHSYDKHWPQAERIYRLNTTLTMPGNQEAKFAAAPLLAAGVMKNYFSPEIALSTRMIRNLRQRIVVDGEEFQDTVVMVDANFEALFPLDILAGSIEATLADPTRIALSETQARRYFGNAPALGRVISLFSYDIAREYQVAAVYRVPGDTVLDIPILRLLDESVLIPSYHYNWMAISGDIYFLLQPEVDVAALNARMAEFTDRMADISATLPDPELVPSDVLAFELQNMARLHLESPFDTTRDGGDMSLVLAFSIISVLVLLMGCANFMILTAAKATERTREVVLRKTLGAERLQLVGQYLAEAALLAAIALVLALALVEMSLPVFAGMLGTSLEFGMVDVNVMLALVGLLVLVVFVGGVYPAVALAWIRPGWVLKAPDAQAFGPSLSFSKVLVVFQFSTAIALIIAALVINAQIRHVSNRDPGYDKENLLVIGNLFSRPEFQQNKEALKQQMLGLSGVVAAGLSSMQPSQGSGGTLPYELEGSSALSFALGFVQIDHDFISTYRIPIVAGRDYDPELDIPSPAFTPGTPQEGRPVSTVLINQRAVRALGFGSAGEALGRILTLTNPVAGRSSYEIIGVVGDANLVSINAEPRAEAYHLGPGTGMLTLRYHGSAQRLLEQVEATWQVVMGDSPLTSTFVEQLLAAEVAEEKASLSILLGFALLAILIAGMGLFGSTLFTLNRRTREVGIRKVMGAEIRELVALFLWQFSQPVLLANLIAWPVALYGLLNWLEGMPYRIDSLLLLPLCMLAAAIALVIAWLTVLGNTWRVANSHPMYVLRYE